MITKFVNRIINGNCVEIMQALPANFYRFGGDFSPL